MNKDTISSLKKRCSKFELPGRNVTPEFLEKLNVSKKRHQQVMKLLQEKVKMVKLSEFQNEVKPFTPLILAPNLSHKNMRIYADTTITTKMTKFFEKIILRKIQTRKNLEQKYPTIIQDILRDAQKEYIDATHASGICCKVKPEDGGECHILLPPYKFPGRTPRRPIFLRNRERIRLNLFLPYFLMRQILKECVMTIPEKLIDFGLYRRKKPYDLKQLAERFGDELMISRYLVRTFYKNIVKFVRGNYYSKIPYRKTEKFLRACTGLLSIYFSRTVENTMLDLAEVTGDDTRIPFLRFNIAVTTVDNRITLSLDPSPDDVLKMFNKTLLAIAELSNNIPVLQSYKLTGFEDDHVPIFITTDFILMCERRIYENLTAMFEPLLEHIKEIEDEFFEVYNKYNAEEHDISFDDGCAYIEFYREYMNNVTGTVENEYFVIGKLEQTDALEHLKTAVEGVMDIIFENLCLQHQYINNDICEQFELLVVRATKKPQTTEELMELGEYMLWANTVLLNDLKQNITDSLVMTTQLIEMGNLSVDHMTLNSTTVNWIYKIKPILEYNASMYEATKQEFEEILQRAIEGVNKGTLALAPYMEMLDDMDDADNTREYLILMGKYLSQIRQMDKTIEWINKEEACFKFQISTYKDLDALRNYINPFYRLVNLCFNWNRTSNAWLDGPFEFLEFSEADGIVDEFMKVLTKTQKSYRNWLRQALAENNPLRFRGSVDDPEFTNLPAPIKLCQKIIQQIKDFRTTLALMSVLCNDALLQRHWDEMSEVAQVDLTPNAGSTLRKYRNMNLIRDFEKYEVISTAAIKERQILQNLLKMQAEWADLKFKTSPYKDTSLKVLTQLDDIQAVLDDHIIKTLSMRGSVFVKPYEDRVKEWYEKIQRINRTIDEWGKVQAQYLYLLPIFSSKDIVAQMPNEGTLFREVNNTYTKYLGVVERDPRVIETAGSKGLMESMIHCSEMLEKINDGVVKYLENKRLFFPRFFFLSNDEMLEILTETKNPLRVQPHLRKCFEAVNELRFDETLKIHGMLSQLQEYTAFLFIIDTEEARGSVEKWLVQVETEMVRAVREQIILSRDDYTATPRTIWVQHWPGQVVLAVSQIFWTIRVHQALQSTAPGALANFSDSLKSSLQDIVTLIRDPALTNLSRITIKALIVIDVHAKDVVEDLVEKRVRDDNEFKWLAQLRYYWEEECLVRLVNATVNYAYEYLGNTDRLVITPLTDRCYRTLIGAYHLHLNGAPEGPAGTGKTETTKDLAKALAVQCVVFNCSDGLDYKAMGKFFKGLAASGAWACFDEFNRIEIEVLSVVAQQILTIILAVRANAKKIVFEGTELPLNPACYVCITMNPGYAGRSELPDNLKVLFRTVAMMVPDYALIGEISLYSYGFVDARKLSVKIVTTYRLCSEQLSSQNHYDYGMRAVKSVLSACGNNKQKFPDENEDILLLRSILDVNLPKFLNHDVPLFEGIISDLFPGTILPKADYGHFLEEAHKACVTRTLQPKESFLTKVIQTYEMMIVRHGFMIVGDPFAGKTSTLYVLADTLTALHERGFPEEKVRYQTMNPKAITGGQLYGQFDPVSYEWFDGVVATCFRSFAMDNSRDRKWIIFDGPVDAVWIENMNTVLDDNKKLCLMSGEVIAMTDVMSLIFEVMDLAQASPATVSRCGMIYMEAATLGWKPFIMSWLPKCDPQWCGEHQQYIEDLFYWLVPPCLTFIRKKLKQLCNTGEIRLVKSMYSIFQMVLDDALKNSIKKEEDMRYIISWIQATFIYAGVWGLGSILDAESRTQFDEYYRGLWTGTDEQDPYPEEFEKLDVPIPFEGILIDYVYYYRARGNWKYWPDTAKSMRVDESTNIQQVLVPTVESEKYMYVVDMHIRYKQPVLLVGPTGTGKSFYMQDLLMNRLNQELYEPSFITFTVQISANQAQELVISKLNKKRRGFYGPPTGKTSIIFIDDLNLPAKEVYGAQPPIELIRQFFDHGNWYDLRTTQPMYLNNVLFLAAMGVVGGSRQEIYPRFLRHFSLFSINEFDDKSMSKIYANLLLVGWRNNGFPSEVITSVNQVVGATLDMYSDATLNLRPTPAKSHYVFNLRDFSRVIFGCSMLRKESAEDRNVFAKVWTHEILRVFYDRLVDVKDRNWVYEKLRESVRNHFKEHFDRVFDHYIVENNTATEEDMTKLMFGTYLDQDSTDDERRYEELLNPKTFIDLAYLSIEEYNATHKSKISVVLFKYALEHLSKICRVLSMSCGSALLVGVSGSGRQSLTKLSSTINNYTLFQPEITKNYGMNEWREDIKTMLKEAGGRGKHSVFLFTEGQMKEEGFLQDIDCLLNSGEVPNIYEIDERQEIVEMVRLAAQGGNRKIDISTLKVFSFFTKRCREKLHIMLCFSPIGSAFRTRLRLYPSLINCCTIDWFESWPEEALEMVARHTMTDIAVPAHVKSAAVIACKHFHVVARNVSDEFFRDTGRKTYITSASYLELIGSFTELTTTKQKEIMNAKNRYLGGLSKLEFAAKQISRMSEELSKLQPQLKIMSEKATTMAKEIAKDAAEAERASALVKKDEEMANAQAAASQALKAECEAELAQALPVLEEALSALDTLKPADITLVKSMQNPPIAVKLTMAAVCVITDIKPDRVKDPNTGRMYMDYWGPSKRFLGDLNFLQKLKDFDKDNIRQDIMNRIRKEYLSDKNFVPSIVAKASSAAEGLCKWIIAMELYDKVAKVVAPKKAKLALAEEQYNATMKFLNEKKAQVAVLEEKLAELNENLRVAQSKQKQLTDDVELCSNKLRRAEQLIGGLGGEKTRWTQCANDLQGQYECLAGDVLVSCGIISYLSPFTSMYRSRSIADWHKVVKELKIPTSQQYDFIRILGTEVKIQNWYINGLPNDAFSTENAIIIDWSRRYSLLIDPQNQANLWIKKLEKKNNLETTKFSHGTYMKVLENCIELGLPCLLENVEEDLEAPLDPILFKITFKQAGMVVIGLGDNVIPFNKDFRLYLTSNLRNPHYLPEIFNKVTIINFALTVEGLQDQLLGIVVARERPDLQTMKEDIIRENANNKAALVQVEENILKTLAESEGDILEDEKAIQVLDKSKTISEEIKADQIVAEQNEITIEASRQVYTIVAKSSAVLYYCISDLPNIDPMYQFSLAWFINLYVSSIESSGKSREIEKRLQSLIETFTYNLYSNVCRSLFEKDKLMFSFVLCSKIRLAKKHLSESEFLFLLTGGVNVENPIPNPCPDWLTAKSWNEMCRVELLPAFNGFRLDFERNSRKWQVIYDSDDPQDRLLPDPWEKSLTSFQKLIALRLIRPDKLTVKISKYIENEMGDEFIKPPPFNIAKSFGESSALCPLIFILSPGTDPMQALVNFAESKSMGLSSISLGQGQGPLAQTLIQKGQETGTWVCLQNCHLAVSWMPMLENLWENMDTQNTHIHFRLWLTSYPSEKFPVSILKYGVKMTNEPPTGLQQNLYKSYFNDPVKNPEFFKGCAKEKMFARLLYGLAFFHAVVQERRTFGPLGWNIPYGFNDSDFDISVHQLQMFINENEDPYEGISYLIGECNYGGRVTDDWDRRLIMAILADFLNPDVVSDMNYKFSEAGKCYGLPVKIEYEDYISHIIELPQIHPPDVFGLHTNAGITRSLKDSQELLNAMIKVHGEGQASSAGETDKLLVMVVTDILSKIPKKFDTEQAQQKYPFEYSESMNTVLVQEMERFNKLLNVIRTSLQNVEKAVEGLVVMTPALELLSNSLILGRIPAAWAKVSYPSLKSLPNYVNDFVERMNFLRKWYEHGKPANFWLSGFFFTQAFLTGAKQNYARKYTIPIDQLTFDFEILKVDTMPQPPSDGIYVYGLYTDGARWDRRRGVIEEQLPKVLYDSMPLMWLIPITVSQYSERGRYVCPLYKTSERRGILSTTGHSTNYVLPFLLDTNVRPSHWIKRSMALLCQLD